jgi:hypothetical protein
LLFIENKGENTFFLKGEITQGEQEERESMRKDSGKITLKYLSSLPV